MVTAIVKLAWSDPLSIIARTSDMFSSVSEYPDPYQDRSSSEDSILLSSMFLHVWIEQRHGLPAEWRLSWLVVQTRPLCLVLLFGKVFGKRFRNLGNCHFDTVYRNGNLHSCTVATCWNTTVSTVLVIWGPTSAHLGSCLC